MPQPGSDAMESLFRRMPMHRDETRSGHRPPDEGGKRPLFSLHAGIISDEEAPPGRLASGAASWWVTET